MAGLCASAHRGHLSLISLLSWVRWSASAGAHAAQPHKAPVSPITATISRSYHHRRLSCSGPGHRRCEKSERRRVAGVRNPSARNTGAVSAEPSEACASNIALQTRERRKAKCTQQVAKEAGFETVLCIVWVWVSDCPNPARSSASSGQIHRHNRNRATNLTPKRHDHYPSTQDFDQ